MHIIGDVKDRTCIIMDDLVDTANTLCEAANALKEHGARKVMAYCTHAVLSGSAAERVTTSAIDEIGRASCRERVCQYVYISVVPVSLNTKFIQTTHSSQLITP